MNRTWSPFWAQALTPTAPISKGTNVDDRHERSQNRVTSSTKRNETFPGEPVDHIRSTTISFRNMGEYGGLLVNYLEVRKLIFLDQLGWHVSETDGMEFDQYDTPFCRWIVVHQFGEVIGGVRMVPTTAKCGPFSYMLRDAQKGLLEDIPTDILFFEAPVEHSVWEATRFFITNSVPAQQRQRVQTLLFRSMCQTAMDNGAAHVLGIVPALWARWARRLGVNATPIGAKFSIDGTASQCVLFKVTDLIS